MSDVKTIWDPVNARGDWVIAGGAVIQQLTTELGFALTTESGEPIIISIPGPPADLQSGDDLETACFISAFTDAAADPDDALPPGETDRRGWWADPTMGSKLWLLRRSKLSPQVVAKARTYLQAAFKWLTDDGVAARVDVLTEQEGLAMLGAQVTIWMQNGSTRTFAYAWAWDQI